MVAGISACYSRVITVRITNQSSGTVNNLEVTYPGGSYGLPHLARNIHHTYSIKPMASRALELKYLDSAGKPRRMIGPVVNPNDQGLIEITITDSGAMAAERLVRAK
jgi:hypothetical protein